MEVLIMLWKNRNKRMGLCLMVVMSCLVLAAVWIILVMPETALAKKPGSGGGDAGTAPVCVEFRDEEGDGVQSDNGTPYCDDKQLKVEAIMTPDGHVNLQPNTGKGDGRTLYVDIDLVDDDPEVGIISTEGWRFLVGGWNESFDMRAMTIGQVRSDVNLSIFTYGNDGNIWRLFFDPARDAWGIDYRESTYVTVTRTAVDIWVVEIDENDQAVRVIQTEVGRNKVQMIYGGVAIVPPFTATITLN
jgi:hypothetical protein